MGLDHRFAEPQQRDGEEQSPNGSDRGEVGPHDVEACTTVENRLGEPDEVGRGERFHETLQSAGHGLQRRIATR